MALTQTDLDRLEAQHQAVQAELLKIVTKTGVSPEQRAIDNARIKVLNKQAADIVAQQRSAQINPKETPFNPVTSKPITATTPPPSGYTQQQVDAVTGYKKKIADIDAALERRDGSVDREKLLATKAQYELEIERIASGQNTATPVPTGPETTPVVIPNPEFITDPSNGQKYRLANSGEPALSGRGLVEPDTSNTISTTRRLAFDGPPLPNVLHQYPSYTYNISLHLLSADEYNNIVKDQKYIPNRVLIASAGRYDKNTFPRSEFFNEDFYFEDLEIETVIGLNAVSRNTNAIKISFTVIEPYGLTLLERLIKAANQIGANDYLEMSYLLQIDFFAQNDAGEIVGKLSDITKYIPIKIAKMGIKAGVKGSEYAIDAFPFNHSAYDQTTITNPEHIEIIAGSIREFFASAPDDPFSTTQTSASVSQRQNTSASSNVTTATSYPTALNKFHLGLQQKNLIGVADHYTFTFDEEISRYDGFTVINLKQATPQSNKMVNRKNTSSIRISNLDDRQSNDMDPDRKIFAIDAGTSIDKVINFVVRMSDYVQQQLAVPEDFGDNPAGYTDKIKANKNAYLNWFKIVPTVTLGEWDNRRKLWKRYINYHVQTYIVKNVKMDTAPQQTATSPVKKYEYLYSGKNDDIIDWDLQFNTLYYNAMTVYKNARATSSSNNISEEIKNKAPEEFKGTIQNPNAVMPNRIKPIILNAQATTGSDALTAREIAVADLEESLLTMNGTDQLQVNLKILGDPAYIKQDDIFYPPSAFEKIQEPDPGVDPRITANNSLRTDFGELYVQLLFSTPEDIDESTGMMSFGANKQTSIFSGLYKVLTVTSRFSQGAFTQVLNLIRLSRQTNFDYATPQPIETDNRQDVDATIAPAPTVEDAAVTTPPPAGDAEEGKKASADEPAAAAEPPVDPEQKDLANVAATANTQPITSQTAPQAVVTPPDAAKVAEIRSKLDRANGIVSELSDTLGINSRSVDFLRRSATVFDFETAKMRQAIIDATAQFGADAPIIKDFERTIASNEKAKAERNAKADAAQAQLDSARAEAASLQSELNTLTGR